MKSIWNIIKEWMLPIAMTTGASIYLIYHLMPEPVHRVGPFLSDFIGVLQPMLIFAMLFLTFCRIEPRDLKPHRWHWWLLLIQGGLFVILGFGAVALRKLVLADTSYAQILIECAMLCLICPTATAAAVVTRKLGGDIPGITTYIVLINILTAVLVPLMIPLLGGQGNLGFWPAFNMIMAKVFPLLITPCLCAWLVRYLFPKLHRSLVKYPDLPFYIWSVALTLAIALTTKAIVHSDASVGLLLSMSGVSLVCCAFQFAFGRYVGGRYGGEARMITAGQSMGQKNTIFLIWLAYTFMTPVTAIVGGLYSVWHNIYNSWQLRHRK